MRSTLFVLIVSGSVLATVSGVASGKVDARDIRTESLGGHQMKIFFVIISKIQIHIRNFIKNVSQSENQKSKLSQMH